MEINPKKLKDPGRKPNNRTAYYTDVPKMHVEWYRQDGAGRQELQ